MAEKLRAFRWLGAFGAANDRKGVLHIDRPDDRERPRRVVRPGETVKDIKNLEVIGAARIAELVADGQAEYLDLLEKMGAEELLNKDRVADDSSKQEIEAAENAAAEAARMNIAKKAQAETARPNDARVTGATAGPTGMTVPAAAPVSVPQPSPVADDILGGSAGV